MLRSFVDERRSAAGAARAPGRHEGISVWYEAMNREEKYDSHTPAVAIPRHHALSGALVREWRHHALSGALVRE